MIGSVITSSGVPTWGGVFVNKREAFTDKFKIVDKQHDELFDTYEVVVLFYTSPKEYTFEVSEEVYNGSKEVIGEEIKRQLSKND